MMDYLSRAVDLNIITVQEDIRRGDDNQMSYARNECLSALAKEVTRGSGTEAVRLLVMEATPRRSRVVTRLISRPCTRYVRPG